MWRFIADLSAVIRDVSLFSGGGGPLFFWGGVIIFSPLVGGRIYNFFQGFLGEDHNFLKVFLLRK